MIAIIDYGAGNLQSVEKAFRFIGAEIEITKDAERLREAEGVVLPGVGAFGDSMASLKSSGLVHTIYDIVEEKKPFLGICLGLQMLFEESEESPGVPGLGILKGKGTRISRYIWPESSSYRLEFSGASEKRWAFCRA